MPTEEIVSINKMLESVGRVIDLDIPNYKVGLDILAMLEIIHEACTSHYPVYWEGIARSLMLEGEYFMNRDLRKASDSYYLATELLVTQPFSAETIGDKEGLLEQALWRQFVVARKLGRHEQAVAAATTGLEGLSYEVDTIDYETGLIYWARIPLGRVRISGWKRFQLQLFMVLSMAKYGQTATKRIGRCRPQ